MVDGSKNVLESEFKRYLDIVKYIYSPFPVSQEDVHVALGVISTNPEIIFSFDKYFDKPSLEMAVNSVEYPRTPQDLNTGESLVVAKETLYSKSTRKGVRQVLVLVVSGRSHDDFFYPVRRLRDGGVEIFCFGVGSKVDAIDLAEIATAPADKHVVVDALDNLLSGARKLIDKLQIAKVEYGKAAFRSFILFISNANKHYRIAIQTLYPGLTLITGCINVFAYITNQINL